MVDPSLAQLRHKVRWAVEPDNPFLITQWLDKERCCGLVAGPTGPCTGCSRARQRRCYDYQFRLLLETVLDELLPGHWRCSCLDQIYKPLHGLQRISNSPALEAHIRRLYQELAVTSQYVQAGLTLQRNQSAT